MHSIVALLRRDISVDEIIQDFVNVQCSDDFNEIIEIYQFQCRVGSRPFLIDEEFTYWFEAMDFVKNYKVEDNKPMKIDEWKAIAYKFCPKYEGVVTLFKIIGLLVHFETNYSWNSLRYLAFRLTFDLLPLVKAEAWNRLRIIDAMLFFLPKRLACDEDDIFCRDCFLESGIYIS